MAELTVIIPTLNRANLLKRVLISLSCQTMCHDDFEVIVVDNGPSSECAEVVEGFQGSISHLRYLEEPAPGLHNARHRGMREANTQFLVYADDDIEAFPGWLEGVWQGFSRHNAALVGGRNLPKWDGEPPAWLARLWTEQKENARSLGSLSVLDFGETEKEIDPSYVWGCNFSIRKDVLLEAGGFHPDSMPDELLHLRGDGESHVSRYIAAHEYRTMYMPSAAVYHFVPRSRMSFNYFKRRAFSQGISDSYSLLRLNSMRTEPVSANGHPLADLIAIPFVRSLLPERVHLEALVDKAYREGFNWHLGRFDRDEEFRQWVLREHYLDS